MSNINFSFTVINSYFCFFIMCVELSLYRLRIGLFNPKLCALVSMIKRSNAQWRYTSTVSKVCETMCRLLVTIFFVTVAIAVCGDVASNPGPKTCSACGQVQSGVAYFSFPLDR